MDKKHFIIITSIVTVIISLIALLLPVEVKNMTGFIIILLSYIIFNIISGYFISNNIEKELKKEIPGLSIFNIFAIFNILIIILLFVSKCVYLNTGILLIILLVILMIYIILMYSLLNAKKTILKKEEEIKVKTSNVKKWRTKLEIIVKNSDKNTKELNELYETLKYMDPMSCDEVLELDKKIDKEINSIKENESTEKISNIIKLLNERKIIIKNNK